MLARSGSLRRDQLNAERVRELARDFVLQREQITSIAVKPFCPQMRVGFGVDKLGIDANPVARPPDASFQHVAHTKFAADLLGVDPLSLIGERGIARDRPCCMDQPVDAVIPGPRGLIRCGRSLGVPAPSCG
jgi:hypothetical protein